MAALAQRPFDFVKSHALWFFFPLFGVAVAAAGIALLLGYRGLATALASVFGVAALFVAIVALEGELPDPGNFSDGSQGGGC